MESIVKIAVIAVAAAICAVVIRKQTPELGLMIGLIAGAIILSLTFGTIKNIREMIDTLAQVAGLSPAIVTPVIKTTGIGITAKLAAEICRDAKEDGIAAFVETAGAAGAIFVCLPLLKSVLAMVTELMQ